MLFASVGGISYEVVLMRLFAVESSSSFGYMFISIAMLAVGMSGTLLAVFREAAIRRRDALLASTSLAAAVLVVVATFGTHLVPFVPLKILEDPGQFLYVGYYYGLFFLPFFAGSSFIALLLTSYAEDVGRLYLFDLVGAAFGGLATVLAMFVVLPEHLPALASAAYGLAHLCVIGRTRWGRRLVPLTVAILAGCAACVFAFADRHVSEFKGISYALATTDVSGARVVTESPGPLGLLQVVESSVERSAPGLSSNTPEELSPPVEMGLYSDGYKLGPLSRDPGPEKAAYLDWMVTAAPFVTRPASSVAVLGVGGGGALREALHHGARHVLGVELNPAVLGLLHDFSAYNGGLLSRDGVTSVVADGRAWAETADERFDLVELNVLDVSGLSFSWSSGASEDYLHTVEAFRAYLRVLVPGGMVAVPVRLNDPARGDLKALTTAIAALDGVAATPRDSVVFVRETFFGVVLMKPDGFTPDELGRLRAFCEEKGFDLSWAPGLKREETNRFTEIQDEAYWRLAEASFASADGLEHFVAEYPFDIAPTHDDRPYFGSLYKDAVLDYYRANAVDPERWWRDIPGDLWSYPMLLAILAQAVVFGALILLLPLALARKTLGRARGKGAVIGYFACLGVGYMLAEMVFIQRLTLVLANPLSSAAVVLSGMLALSGIGAGLSERFARRPGRILWIAVAVVSLNVLLLAMLPLSWMRPLIALPIAGRVVASLVLIGPASLCLGFFFPLGIGVVARREPALVGWAFGINGALSVPAVVGASLATLQYGFTVVLAAVCVLYVAARLFYSRLGTGGE